MTLVAARRLNCPPWDIDDDEDGWPFTWRARALMALDCENTAEQQRNRAAGR